VRRHTTALAALLIAFAVGACGSTTSPSGASGNPAGTPVSGIGGGGALFSIEEIGVGAVGYVTLKNFTDTPARLDGLTLCQGGDCFALPDAAVDAGASARIATGDGAGLSDVVATNATLGTLKPEDGEIALFGNGKLDDSANMYGYVEWGSDPHALTPLAIKAGLWMAGSFAPTSANATRLFREDTGLWLFDE